MKKRLDLVSIAAIAFLAIGAAPAQAAPSDQPLMFGKGQPASIDDLPPGRTRERLQSLPPAARERALEWLQYLEFPAADLDTLHIDDRGDVFYADPVTPSPVPDNE